MMLLEAVFVWPMCALEAFIDTYVHSASTSLLYTFSPTALLRYMFGDLEGCVRSKLMQLMMLACMYVTDV